MADITTAMPPVAPALLLDARTAAKALSISPRTLWTLTQTGRVSCIRIGRRVLFDPRDLTAFIDTVKAVAQ